MTDRSSGDRRTTCPSSGVECGVKAVVNRFNESHTPRLLPISLAAIALPCPSEILRPPCFLVHAVPSSLNGDSGHTKDVCNRYLLTQWDDRTPNESVQSSSFNLIYVYTSRFVAILTTNL